MNVTQKPIKHDGKAAPLERLITETLARFAPHLQGYQVFLFGSRAGGYARARSDFDIGVYGPQAMPIQVFYAIETAFEELPTLYKIDWVDFNRVSDTFREEAMKTRKILYG